MPIVVVNGSPIPSVTGLSPCGGAESPVIVRAQPGRDRAQRSAGRRARAAARAARACRPARRARVATERVSSWLVYAAPSGPCPARTCFWVCAASGALTRCSSSWFCHMQTANAATSDGERHDQPRAQLVEMLDEPQSLIVARPLDRDRHRQPRRLAQRPASASRVGSAYDADGTGATGAPTGAAGVSRLAACDCTAAEAVLESAHAVAERAPDLGQALGAEHEQHDQQQNENVDRVIETHCRPSFLGVVSE